MKKYLKYPENSDGRCLSCAARPHCPNGWDRLGRGKHCYRLFQEKKTWKDAELYCNSQGGHLAAVITQDIHNYVNGKNAPVWVGGTDHVREGAWRWSDCSAWRFEPWSVDIFCLGPLCFENNKQPNNGLPLHNRENCLQLRHRNDDKWHDVVCSKLHNFVCSIKLCPTTTPAGINRLFWLMITTLSDSFYDYDIREYTHNGKRHLQPRR